MEGKYKIVEQTFNPGLALIGLSGTGFKPMRKGGIFNE